ncbi:SLOG family protein [Hymenobacter pini]|uniref:SLOG family protein n=1 Tax=Hymenobacter pini TaxID=2880879 RepID=UPI001CF46396|nr:SLOG family protein [Hymenobacter pini]MCA8831925.1 DUF2493 domain-containing protein [Hymenobacter pini]
MENVQKVVAVVGSRGLVQAPGLLTRLAALQAAGELAQVVSGGAAGVDSLAAEWCRAHRVPLLVLRPDYRTHGPAAPHVRNAAIVQRADLVLICWDGQSRGTLSAARAAARLGRRCEWLAAQPPSSTLGL